MSFRLRRTLILLPGVRLNLSQSGESASLGPRGVSLTLDRSGAYLNVGLPGSGLSYRTRLSKAKSKVTRASSAKTPNLDLELDKNVANVSYSLSESLELELRNSDTGEVLESRQHQAFIAENDEEIEDFLLQAARVITTGIKGAGLPHLSGAIRRPRPFVDPVDELERPQVFGEQAVQSIPKSPTGSKGRKDARPRDVRAYRLALRKWIAVHEERLRKVAERWGPYSVAHTAYRNRLREAKRRMVTDESYFGICLDACLKAIPWPRDTRCFCEAEEKIASISYDVDLPEHGDMPSEVVKCVAGEHRLEWRPLSPDEREKVWKGCVLSIAAALIKMTFTLTPHLKRIKIKGYRELSEEADLFRSAPLVEIDISRGQYDWDRRELFEKDELYGMLKRSWCRFG